ncbi:MAG TPA: ABC transporter permease [Thermoplasmata archaeon]|nr:ABC transporter permease [Thermoplasmata archaeon]
MATATSMPATPHDGRVLPAFGVIGWRWISRNPAAAIAPILQPFIFLYFLSLISPPGLFPLEILGAMLFTTQNIGSWVMGDSATWRIELAVQDMFIASPLGKVRYLFGVAFSNLIAAAPALIVLAVLLDVVLPHRVPWTAWLVLGGCLTVVWILFSSIGVAISSRLTSQREIWPVGNLTFTVVGMLSPLYYPLSYLPPTWQRIAHFLPTTYAALLVQGAFGITPATPTQMVEYVALLLGLAVVGTFVALRMYRWRAP